MSKGELLCIAATGDAGYWDSLSEYDKQSWEQQAERYEQLKAEKFPDAHANALAEAGRLREAISCFIADAKHPIPADDTREAGWYCCLCGVADAHREDCSLPVTEETLSSTPTTAAWLEARDKAIREPLEKEIAELQLRYSQLRHIHAEAITLLAGVVKSGNISTAAKMLISQISNIEDAKALLEARDRRMKAIGAAEEWELEAGIAKAAGRDLITYQREYLEQRAAQLRREAGE